MSIHRRAAKRDTTERAIIQALRAHGCVVWEVSGTGIPDLIVMKGGKKWLADAKGPNGKPTPAQEKKWKEAAAKAQCAVFILRTPEDAVAMLRGGLMPWEPVRCQNQQPRSGESRQHLAQIRRSAEVKIRGMGHAIRDQDPQWLKARPAHRLDCLRVVGEDAREPCTCGAMDAAKEAEATFAPAADGHKPCAAPGCRMRVMGSDTCMAHDDGAWGLCGVAGCGRPPVGDGLCEEHR